MAGRVCAYRAYDENALIRLKQILLLRRLRIPVRQIRTKQKLLPICPTYIGAVSKKLRSLCKEYSDLLLEKRVGIFLYCAFSEQTQEYLSSNFSAELLKNAVVIKSFGGEARIDKMTAFDKLIMKAAAKSRNKNLNISQENMDVFIKELVSKN